MGSLQNSTIHPEIGPRNSVGRGDSAPAPTGTIVFNQRPSSSDDPRATIARAIAEGDTTEKRLRLFQAAVSTPSTEEF